MARVASCPQCEHDLLVPDDADPSALVKCPQCRGFFELQHAASRELPAALVVDSHAPPASEITELSKSPTVDDFSSLATIKGDAEPISEEDLKSEPDFLEFAPEEPIEFAKNEPRTLAQEEPGAELPRIADEPSDYKVPGAESHEEAAQRIDQWFRSAKTLSDLPPLEPGDLAGKASEELFEPAQVAGTEPVDPIDFRSEDKAAFSGSTPDLELQPPAEHSDSSNEGPAWDDSQHMDRLLSDLESQPLDKLDASVGDEITLADEPQDVHELHQVQETFQPTSDWTPDESLAASATVGKPEKKKSVVRTLVFSPVVGVLGLALGYYALLWLGPVLGRGKDIDFLQIANYLPTAMLPAAFRSDVKKPIAMPPAKMMADLAASEKENATKSEQPSAPAGPAAPAEAKSENPSPSAETTAQMPAPPAEKQTAFTTPAEPLKKPADIDDRYAVPATKTEPAIREPAPLEAPPAKSITESEPKTEPVRIANGPSFTGADVTAALQAASAAESGLVTGNLHDGKEIAHTKGVSYMAIADFAQKATFADPADASKAQQASDEFFRKLLSTPHARDEVAQIAPRWMSHPRRPQNGVFLAGTASNGELKGSVIEYNVELSGGPKVVVVVPAADAKALDASAKPVGVVGAIIDKPADEISGYTGSAPQVVFAKKLLPLE
jgi:hypothetical protein